MHWLRFSQKIQGVFLNFFCSVSSNNTSGKSMVCINFTSSYQRCSVKKGVESCNFMKKETPTQVFYREFWGIFKNTFYTEKTSASETLIKRLWNWYTNEYAFFIVKPRFKGIVIQTETALINNRLRVSKVSWKFRISNIYNFAVIYPWNLFFSFKSSLLFNSFYCLFCL